MPRRTTGSTPRHAGAHAIPPEDAALPDATASISEQRPDTGGPPAGPAFARGLWRIAAADVSTGNAVELLHDGPRTYDAMIAAIAAARESVVLESYILRSDETGQRFAGALVDAVSRGVDVRVLTDWIGMRGIRSSFVATLRRAGVELRVFNPPGLRAWFGLVPRDHRKLLVVDRTVGITGGVGIGDEWMGKTARHRGHWRDTAVRIEGPAARDMHTAFETMWQRSYKRERRGSHRFTSSVARGAHLDPATAEPALVGVVEGEPFRMRIARALQMQAISAQRSIWIANAYFVPSWSEIEALMGAARDGVDVRILVPQRNDHPWVTMLTRRYYRRLLTNGVRIWEYKGAMMHAKTSVVDGRWVRVGSTDFNPLGVAINYELDAVIEDPALGAKAEAMFLADLERSKEITMRSRVVGR
ncbi:MAG TPA: phosphatidylserine/phosphatidylglycerophosphate/cardiolipin synthase family protein [Gemmatimonadaceae bacterium]|nr:phosphatidylserine/phosphatidylglycerophosphate/cardiolipin synthase family protein [Gemmatimonadaceae bacterium]